MKLVLVGGHERMKCQYCDLCKGWGYKAKVFSKMPSEMTKKIGCPEAIIIFENTVSHKMVNMVCTEAKRKNIPVFRCGNSSACALKNALSKLKEENINR